MSNRRLTLEDRRQIQGLLHNNLKHEKICEMVGINRGTLYREFKKCKGAYNAEESHQNTSRGYKEIDFSVIGKKFGLLTITDYVHKYNHRTYWKCKCDCGKFTIISRKILAERCSERRPLSCGCVPKQWKKKGDDVPWEEACLRKYEDMIKFRKMEGSCWIWMGYRQGGKFPRTSFRNVAMGVGKCMYIIMNGLKYEENPVYVTCGTQFCFNPDHLSLDKPYIKRGPYKKREKNV